MSPSLATRADRMQQGKSLRKLTPRALHGKLLGPLERDPAAVLKAQNATRLPALVELRRQLMASSPFAYLRGAAAVMAHDLQWQPMAGAKVQACGDCHLMNFGAFVTPEDNILFDINDFDETLPGVDFSVDLKRLATSIVVAAAAGGAAKSERHALAAAAVRAYRKRMEGLSYLSPVKSGTAGSTWSWRSRNSATPPCARRCRRSWRGRAAMASTSTTIFRHWRNSGAPLIHDKAPRIFHFAPGSDAAMGFVAQTDLARYRASLQPVAAVLYDRYALKDFVFKAVGVGSVGTYCYVGLFMSGDDEPLFLQAKEAVHSVLEILDDKLALEGHQGRRVVDGQRMMQAASDIFLGWTENDESGRQYYVRILKNRRLGGISEIAETEGLSDYARLCGRTLARAHARSGDPAVISGYMGSSDAFDLAIADFALAYADRNEADHAAWVAAEPPAEKEAPPAEKDASAPPDGKKAAPARTTKKRPAKTARDSDKTGKDSDENPPAA